MIRIHCDRCEKPFDVADDTAGTKVECPKCGDVNRVPAAQAPLPGAPPSGISTTPTKGPSAPLRTITHRRAPLRAHPLAATALIAGPAALTILGWTQGWKPMVNYWGWALPLACWAGLGVWAAFVTFSEKLRILPESVRHEKGLLSRNASEVRFRDVQLVNVRQSFLQRLLSTGALAISTADSDVFEIEIKLLDDPMGAEREIKQRMTFTRNA